MKRFVAILLILAMTICTGGCSTKAEVNDINGTSDNNMNGDLVPDTGDDNENLKPELTAAFFAEDYKQVYQKLVEISSESSGDKGYREFSNNIAVDEAVADAPAAEQEVPVKESTSAADTAAGGSYSQTNVQVAGIDEGDIVKTDGKYIYVLQNYDLVIFEANGADTREMSRTTVGYDKYDEGENRWYSEWKSPVEMYVSDGKVIIISYYGSYENNMDEIGIWNYNDKSYTSVDIYDVSDPSFPKLENKLGQDGSKIASRFVDGMLYIVTSYYTWNWDENDPGTYIPRLYSGDKEVLIDAADICIVGSPTGTGYTIVSAYDLATGAAVDTKTILGGGEIVYMNADNLFVAGSRHKTDESEPRTESIYKVVDYSESWDTEITRFSVEHGEMTLAASGTVPGTLESQFSMDEYEGYLRLVTTQDTYSYTVYTDEERGFVNYDWHDDSNSSWNNLYVLDADLSISGSIENLAEDERIYSARFDGDIGYFCTFETIDPLFSVDLSVPENPTILGALKIPGFSEYLHIWSNGLLFGLGYDTAEHTDGDNKWVTTDGIKLSMFDTSDPADVTEEYKLSLDSRYSEALYNHKAILVSAEKDLIAFPSEGGYAVYGFSQDSGFYEKAFIKCEWDWNARGLYIDEYFYVVSQGLIAVLDLNTLSLVREINTAAG